MERHIWELAPTDILDYPFLMDYLKDYKKPRSKLTSLLKKKELIRVKKGLYVLQGPLSRGLYSREELANLIYGPSYISFEYALSYYGLILERVEEVTSVTCLRNKKFQTPLGYFSYHYLHPEKYPVGVTYVHIDEKRGFLIAIKEKALADCVARHSGLKTKEEVSGYLAGMRVEPSDLAKINLKKMSKIAKIYRNHQVDLLKEIIVGYHELYK